jgi:hypothetical protein
MTIERKFNMFSTREWIQYLQYKLSPEREKELAENADRDPFLKEALDAISAQENRPIAFQSISYLISIVEENTGVSESKITRAATTRRSSSPISNETFNPKLILLIAGGLALACILGFGIYTLINHQSTSNNIEEITTQADSTSISNANYADSSARPFDILPSGTVAVDTTPKPVVNPSTSARKPISQQPQETIYPTTTTTVNSSTPSTASSASNGNGKERELFNKAQELYMQDKRDEAKKILRELKSYDNPMKAQAENILTSIDK